MEKVADDRAGSCLQAARPELRPRAGEPRIQGTSTGRFRSGIQNSLLQALRPCLRFGRSRRAPISCPPRSKVLNLILAMESSSMAASRRTRAAVGDRAARDAGFSLTLGRSTGWQACGGPVQGL